MREFKSESSFKITGRGTVFSCPLKDNELISSLQSLVGTHVLIDEQEYLLTGVEKYAVNFDYLTNVANLLVKNI